jgi:hypothetical protein
MKTMLHFLHRHSTLFVFLAITLLYLFTLRGVAGTPIPNQTSNVDFSQPPFETSMERGRYAQIISLAFHSTFTVDDYASFLKPDLAWYNGHYFPAFPPGTALLSVPALLLGNQFGLGQVFAYGVTTVIALLTGFVLFKICKQLGLEKRSGLFVASIYLLTSMVWAYSVTLSAHPVSALLLALGFWIYLLLGKGKHDFVFFSLLWLVYGLNIFIDYPNLVIFLPILVASFIKVLRKKFSLLPMLSSFTFAILLGLFAFYSLIHYSKPFAFTNTYNLRPLEKIGISVEQKDLNNDIFKKKPYENRFTLAAAQDGTYTLLWSEDRGLFYYFPVFLLGFGGLFFLVKNRLAFVIMTTLLLDILIYGSFDDPWGGWGFGPRYLIVTLPLLAIAAGVGFEKSIKTKLPFLFNIGIKLLISLVVLYSSGVALLGASTTNAIPPSVEMEFVAPGMHDNFVQNWQYMQDGMASAFLYRIYFVQILSSVQYAGWIYAGAALILLSIIWSPNLNNKPSIIFHASRSKKRKSL